MAAGWLPLPRRARACRRCAIDGAGRSRGEPLWRGNARPGQRFCRRGADRLSSTRRSTTSRRRARSRRLTGRQRRQVTALPACPPRWTRRGRSSRRAAAARPPSGAPHAELLALAPARAAVQPGDVLRSPTARPGDFLVTRIEDGAVRAGGGARLRQRARAPIRGLRHARAGTAAAPRRFRAASSHCWTCRVLDGTDGDGIGAGRVPSAGRWRQLALVRIGDDRGLCGSAPCSTGRRGSARLPRALAPALPGRFDRRRRSRSTCLRRAVARRQTRGACRRQPHGGALCGNGAWEVLQFAAAPRKSRAGRWRLSGLLRGLAGTEDAMAAGAPAGARGRAARRRGAAARA